MSVSSRVNEKPNPLFKMFSHIFAVITEQERKQIKERTEMGKVAARQKGVVFGRKPSSNERKVDFLGKDGTKKILKIFINRRIHNHRNKQVNRVIYCNCYESEKQCFRNKGFISIRQQSQFLLINAKTNLKE